MRRSNYLFNLFFFFQFFGYPSDSVKTIYPGSNDLVDAEREIRPAEWKNIKYRVDSCVIVLRIFERVSVTNIILYE